MDLQTLAALGEFFGGVAVVVSLVYLALQVRQNTQSQRTENYSRALDRIAAIQSQLARDAGFSRVLARGVADASVLTPPERIQFTWILYETFGAFEFMFYAAQTRALPDEVWARWSSTIAWWLSFPGAQTWWENRPAPFSASFTAFIEDLLRDNPTDRAAVARWQTFLARGGAPAVPATDDLPPA
jgi:hypothetical protein